MRETNPSLVGMRDTLVFCIECARSGMVETRQGRSRCQICTVGRRSCSKSRGISRPTTALFDMRHTFHPFQHPVRLVTSRVQRTAPTYIGILPVRSSATPAPGIASPLKTGQSLIQERRTFALGIVSTPPATGSVKWNDTEEWLGLEEHLRVDPQDEIWRSASELIVRRNGLSSELKPRHASGSIVHSRCDNATQRQTNN